jgi:hypothetical protein
MTTTTTTTRPALQPPLLLCPPLLGRRPASPVATQSAPDDIQLLQPVFWQPAQQAPTPPPPQPAIWPPAQQVPPSTS